MRIRSEREGSERERRRTLERLVLDWIRAGVFQARDDERFSELALRLFAHQFEHNEPYRILCRSQGIDTPNRSDWRSIPLVPSSAFKQARLACFAAEATCKIFRSSGTTAASSSTGTRDTGAQCDDIRSELHLDTLELYESSLLETFPAFVCPELAAGERMPFCVLAPDPRRAPDSSLSHMFGVVVEHLGAANSRFWLEPDVAPGVPALDLAGLVRSLREASEALALVGTAFAFVHLLDHLEQRELVLALPEGSRILETGGFKGRSRELPREALHAALSTRLGVASHRIVNQYGMCELATQFYEPSLIEGAATSWKRVPPWARIRAVSPATLEDVAAGDVGVLAIYDLANSGSVLGLLTADLGRVRGDRVEVIGRAPGAELRGCSLAAEAWLTR